MADLSSKLNNLTPEQRALLLKKLAKSGGGAAPPLPTLRPREKGEPRVLSFAQEQLWFVDQLTPGSSAYNVPYPVRLIGRLDADALQRALDSFVGRHEVLRTMLPALRGKPIPLVAKEWSVEMARIDATGWTEEKLFEAIGVDASRPFDLARGLKLRASLYQLGPEQCIFLHNTHHIAWDLRSRLIFYNELAAFYDAYTNDREPDLPPSPLQYSDFAAWQRAYLTGETLASLTAYWQEKLAGAPPHIELKIDKPRPTHQDLTGAKLPFSLTGSEIADARQTARDAGVSLYVVLLSAFKIFLSCCSGQNDISIGTPFAGRQPQLESTIGMFINTLVMRTVLSEGQSFRDVMQSVRETVHGGLGHQELPFEKIVEAVRPPRDPSRMALFQVNFRLQEGAAAPLELPGIKTEPMSVVDTSISKFDLALELNSSTESSGYFEYSTGLFEEPTILRMADDFRAILRTLLDHPEDTIAGMATIREVRSHYQFGGSSEI